MRRNKNREDGTRPFGSWKLLAAGTLILVVTAAVLAYVHFFSGEQSVGFEQVKEDRIPAEITADVIPEYRSLERALACMVDDCVYVIVTRGEKPTSGFGVSVDRMALEEEDGKTNLIVYAQFDDPNKETAISQIITYPLQVVRTDLEQLPDTIELRIQY